MPSNKKQLLTVLLESGIYDRMEDFRFANRINTRSETVRILIERGLTVKQKPAKKKAPSAKKSASRTI
jgi:hypothetical protein